MRFRITHHSGFAVPAEALELLWARLGATRDGVAFAKAGPAILATPRQDAPVSMTRDERVEIGRRAVLELIGEACDGSSDLKSDWFAVSAES